MNESAELRKLYSDKYFRHCCRGSNEFEGGKLHHSFKRALSELKPHKGDRVIDIGCGRGEAVIECGRRGCLSIGTDFSMNALRIAAGNARGKAFFVLADATELPFRSAAFNKAFFLETLEHVPKEKEAGLFSEIERVLCGKGKLFVTTSPSSFVSKPLYAIAGLLGMKRGLNEQMHVNEKNYFSLRASLRRAGFSPRIKMRFVPEWFEVAVKGKRFDFVFLPFVGILKSRPVKWLCGRSPLRFFFGTHLGAFAEKGERKAGRV